MKNILLAFCLSLIFSIANSQNEGNIWYFGNNAGLDFNSGEPVVLSDGQMSTSEGCASIANEDGELLFYTDGINVWNANHQIMPNGTGLLGHPSSTQSSIIVKRPMSTTEYYIFTIDDLLSADGLYYSIVDMTLEGGLGDINEVKNVLVLANTTEKITAIPHENGVDFWLVTLINDGPDFYAYFLDENGLDAEAVISPVGAEFNDFNSNSVGYIKASGQGDRIACAYWQQDFLEVFDFDNSTGVLSNPIQLDLYDSYGLEFSEEGNLLYVNAWNTDLNIYQYNLEAGSEADINETKYTISEPGQSFFGALQMAPDGMIYLAEGWSNNLHRITEPSVIGEGCNFEFAAVDLSPGQSTNGLPTFFSSIFTQVTMSSEHTCIGDETWITVSYSGFDSLYWDLGDGANSIYYEIPVIHQFSDTGTYDIFFVGYKDGEADTSNFELYIKPLPVVYIGEDQELCEGESLLLDAEQEGGSYVWQNGSTVSQYEAWNIGDYWVEVTVNECVSSDSIWLYHCDAYVGYPNIFTPNNDGRNDVFEPVYQRDVVSSHLQIMDRWGVLKFESKNINESWDGSFKDAKCSDGVYFYMLYFVGSNGKEHETTGSLTLTRERSR